MTATGLIIMVVCALLYKSESEFFWNQYPRAKMIVETLWTIGFLLFVAGFSVFFWRNLP